MTMSKTKTAVGMVAACAAASATSSSATLAAPLSSARAGAGAPPLRSGPSWRVPRGGASAETGSAAAPNDGEKKRRKKKKKPRGEKPKRGTGEGAAGDAESSGPLPPAAAAILTETCHYGVLGVAATATSAEIQKAYRRRCVLTHPDKTGGDRSAFDRVSLAYDVLSSAEKRVVYDRNGAQGLDDVDPHAAAGPGGGMGGGGAFFGHDVFREFFGAADPFLGRRTGAGGAHPFRRGAAPPRNRDLRYELEVTLEDLYTGATKRVAIRQPDPLRPHFPRREEVDVELPPGLAPGRSVRLSGVVDGAPGAPADLVFLVKQRRHPLYARRGADLALEVRISLAEAIGGFAREIPCLDGTRITIGSPVAAQREGGEAVAPAEDDAAAEDAVSGAGSDADAVEAPVADAGVQADADADVHELPPAVIASGDVHVLEGRGMPKEGAAHEHGDLYVQYVVETPGTAAAAGAGGASADRLSPRERAELARLLRKLEGREEDPARASAPGAVHRLTVAAAEDFGRSAAAADAAHDHEEHLDHDDDPHGGGMRAEDAGEFFRQAFGGGGGSGFHFFSSSGAGRGYGGQRAGGGGGEEQERPVECNQM